MEHDDRTAEPTLTDIGRLWLLGDVLHNQVEALVKVEAEIDHLMMELDDRRSPGDHDGF